MSGNATLLPLTNVPLHLIHLTPYKHLSRSAQLVFGLVEDLLIHYSAKAPGLTWIGPIELLECTAEGLQEVFFGIYMAQDVVRCHSTLASIMKSCPGNATSRGVDVTLTINITRVFTTQHQSHTS